MKDLLKKIHPQKILLAPCKKNISHVWPPNFYPANSFLFGDLQCIELLILLTFSPINGLVFFYNIPLGPNIYLVYTIKVLLE